MDSDSQQEIYNCITYEEQPIDTATKKGFSKQVTKKRNVPAFKFPDVNFEHCPTFNVMNGRYPIDMILKVVCPDDDDDDENAVLITLNKSVVSSSFGYFKAMFDRNSNWAEANFIFEWDNLQNNPDNLPVTTLKDFNPESVVQYFVNFFKDSLTVTLKNCIEFYKLADYLNDNYGKEEILAIVMDNLSEENFVDFYLELEVPMKVNVGCFKWVKDYIKNIIDPDFGTARKICRYSNEEEFITLWSLFNKCEFDCEFMKIILLSWIFDAFNKNFSANKKQKIDESLFEKNSSNDDNEMTNDTDSNELYPLLSKFDLSKVLTDTDTQGDRVKFFNRFSKIIKSGSDFKNVYFLIIGGNNHLKVDDNENDFGDGELMEKETHLKGLKRDRCKISKNRLSKIVTLASYDKDQMTMKVKDKSILISRKGNCGASNGTVIFSSCGIKSFTLTNVDSCSISLGYNTYRCKYVGWTETEDKSNHGRSYIDKSLLLGSNGHLTMDINIYEDTKWDEKNDQVTIEHERGGKLSWSVGSSVIRRSKKAYNFKGGKFYPVIMMYDTKHQVKISNIKFE